MKLLGNLEVDSEGRILIDKPSARQLARFKNIKSRKARVVNKYAKKALHEAIGAAIDQLDTGDKK